MKSFLLLSLLSFIDLFSNAQSQQTNFTKADAAWQSNAQAYILKSEYYFKSFSSSFGCANRKQNVIYTVGSNGYSVAPIDNGNNDALHKPWHASLQLLEISKGALAMKPVSQPLYTMYDGSLVQSHHFFYIQYTNNEDGLRQNFIITQKPKGTENLRVTMQIEDSGLHLELLNNNALKFQNDSGKTILQYDGLKVWDANDKPLKAFMKLSDKNILEIIVDDRKAKYPLTIDPLNHSPEWTGTATGILPTLIGQLAIDAAYGFSVAGVGDVNGDGFDDVAVGAPGLVDIISGSGALASVGAVFVYYGSLNGLSIVPDAKLQSSSSVAGALFGFSIAGGDINGDGKNDIIVGAPLDKVTISIGGGSTASGTVGKVYVFNGGSLSATTTSASLVLQLSGAGILQNGVNLSINALFGFSVAVTDDLNNDGKKDIIVGSPTYAGITTNLFGVSIADVQSGAAFVFLSSSSSNNFSLQKLNPPTTSLLGLGLLSSNVNGLLFGISVDGAGDYNGDGYPDIVVGAPAGVDLSSLSALLSGKILQGSAMVYYGNGSGVTAQAGAFLSASLGSVISNLSGTLANVANLFGYCVRGVKNASGARTGSILVGAPLGGTLTNLFSGLQVKTGTVSVFIKKSSSVSGIITPDQQLTSPRNANNVLNLIQSSLLFGFSIDNVYDVNCDGIGDIIIGEPASSGAQLIGANVAGGSAYVFTGNANGTYSTSPSWTLGATYDATLGVNVASLIGYSVAGAGKVKGITNSNKILVGAPGRTLDFGVGLLNLGNTFSTLFGLIAGDNGVGKAYLFDTQLCSIPSLQTLPIIMSSFNAVLQSGDKVLVTWEVSTEKDINSFTIERSKDGVLWNIFVMIHGNPDADKNENFSIPDNNPFTGVSYYRLKQISIDNHVSYSETKMIHIEGPASNITVVNPFKSFITIQLNSQRENNIQISLMDVNGKIIFHQNKLVVAGLNTIHLYDLDYLIRGIYFISITNVDENYKARF